ncbi:hypothetical protein [Pokkaliibacter sp. CJK22405]|uniref:hypothetical protein n=1 Tax=Pokkaliibacter sp. CJK22405 TaxID=3384615 RepID=UPI003984C709
MSVFDRSDSIEVRSHTDEQKMPKRHRVFVVGSLAMAGDRAFVSERTWAYQTKSAFFDGVILAAVLFLLNLPGGQCDDGKGSRNAAIRNATVSTANKQLPKTQSDVPMWFLAHNLHGSQADQSPLSSCTIWAFSFIPAYTDDLTRAIFCL